MKKALITLIITIFFLKIQAQTADQIVQKYIQQMGGEKAWKAIKQLALRENIIMVALNSLSMPLPKLLIDTNSLCLCMVNIIHKFLMEKPIGKLRLSKTKPFRNASRVNRPCFGK